MLHLLFATVVMAAQAIQPVQSAGRQPASVSVPFDEARRHLLIGRMARGANHFEGQGPEHS